ncbi:NAD-dependent succinate-semialdehyde dehydrogenase [Conexibacter sp. CPCC 206217]|uniref:NAD-dependent succinate-semialdehyde dehydrogenase n=1 Tax=Conexibacter sp. CPCC 206217 TaxID=3064574 RepID=UPI002726B2F2|nr:NAD-dependent succinate-semialdehyde dehydrogenase [Conexibacter sp. CPCC 206217]MDO8212502.1 NAD-dependent succinate-semialdehyde dehydrogenase [Conexibacter sp. CPCC 206217]
MAATTIHPDKDALLQRVPTGLYIAGEWRAATGGRTLGVEDPATGETLAEIADATPEDAVAALDAACAVQEQWAQHPPRERGEILRRAFEELIDRSEELSLLMTLEMGKPLSEARGEIAYAAEYFRWFSEEAVRIDGRYATAPDGRSRLLVMKQPVGPCLLITPWNFPMAMGTRKIGPAIAAGCTMVMKPAKQTPLSTFALADILERAGLPAGVLNVIASSSASSIITPLITDARMRKVSFTGSTEIGRLLVKQGAEQLLRSSMELGGNAPFVVFEDADLDKAVEGAMLAKMRNGGEACTAANRFFVHDSVADEFTKRLAERMGDLKVGHGAADGTQVGPLIDGTERAKVAALVDDARERGAEVLTGGAPVDGPGYFYAPTVLRSVPLGARVLEEEIFGPVAPVQTFTDEDDVVARANATEYGLVAYVFTRDLDRALRVGAHLETGMLGINQGIVSNPAAPFGGVKHSGFGREGGREGIDEYLATKYFAIANG